MSKTSEKTKRYYKSQRENTSQKRLKLKRLLINHLGGKCIDCGFNAHLAALDFDHLNPEEKKFTIGPKLSQYIFEKKGTMEELFEEVEKCVIRCANCHRIKTHPKATD